MDKKLDIWSLLKSIETEKKICCRCLCLSLDKWLTSEGKDGRWYCFDCLKFRKK